MKRPGDVLIKSVIVSNCEMDIMAPLNKYDESIFGYTHFSFCESERFELLSNHVSYFASLRCLLKSRKLIT